MSVVNWGHDNLAEDLAGYLSGYSRPCMVWTNMQLGPSGSMRPDVFAIDKTYTRVIARAFEVKVSRSDFLADATAGKALKYLSVAGSLTFAAPKGLIKIGELPQGAGLIERGPESWRYSRKPVIRGSTELGEGVWLKLVIDGVKRERSLLLGTKPRDANEWAQTERLRKMFGAEIADAQRDLNHALINLRQKIDAVSVGASDFQRRQKEKELAEAAAGIEEWRKLLDEMGLPDYTTPRALREHVATLRGDNDKQRIQCALNGIENAKRELDRQAAGIRDAMGIESSKNGGGQ